MRKKNSEYKVRQRCDQREKAQDSCIEKWMKPAPFYDNESVQSNSLQGAPDFPAADFFS